MASLPNTKIEETHNLLFHRHINFCLASCPSCSVGCCISQRLSLSLSSRPARRLGLCCFSCLHLLSCLHLSLCPSCLVGCRIAQRLTPPISSPLLLMPQTPPLVAPLSSSWFVTLPSALPIVLIGGALIKKNTS